jgi:hypothetical protein
MTTIIKLTIFIKLILILTKHLIEYFWYGLWNFIKTIFKLWDRLGSYFVKHTFVWWVFTLLILAMGFGNLVKSYELQSTTASAQVVILENQDLQLKLKTALQRQSEIDNALKSLEDNLKNSNSGEVKVTASEITQSTIEVPAKWKAHTEYVSNSLKDNKALQGAVEGYKNNQNKYGFYSKTDCHPFLMGAIHYREYGFTLKNGWNGQGMYQNLSNRYGQDTIVTNATEQTQQACDFIKAKAKSFCSKYGVPDDLNNLDNIELIGCSLAKYNGCMGKHYNQCGYTVKGLSETQEDFLKCGADFTCPIVKEKQLGALTVILALLLSQ